MDVIQQIQEWSDHCTCSEVSEHAMPLWCEHFDKELVSKGIEVQTWWLITSESGKICIENALQFLISVPSSRILLELF